MLTETFSLKVSGSQSYARLCTYIIDNSDELMIKKRPLILICPGGGYEWTSDREAEPLALRFLAMGYHVAVLRYSCKPAVFPTALLELSQAMKLIYGYKEEWNVEADKIFVLGCSAGGHLAASLGMFWNTEWLSKESGVPNEQLKPAGMILCYPVITAGPLAHQGSFENLLGENDTAEMRERVSLEKHVSKDTPQTFIWHTFTDDTVPVENSLLLVNELKKHNISTEFHMYPIGVHGLSTADDLARNAIGIGVQEECQSWLPLVYTWLKNR